MLRCFQWDDIHGAVSRLRPASGFRRRFHEEDSRPEQYYKITRLDKPAGER